MVSEPLAVFHREEGAGFASILVSHRLSGSPLLQVSALHDGRWYFWAECTHPLRPQLASPVTDEVHRWLRRDPV